jgi:hypothetical protein
MGTRRPDQTGSDEPSEKETQDIRSPSNRPTAPPNASYSKVRAASRSEEKMSELLDEELAVDIDVVIDPSVPPPAPVPVEVVVPELAITRDELGWVSIPPGTSALVDAIDGSKSLRQIAEECGISMDEANGQLERLVAKGVVKVQS